MKILIIINGSESDEEFVRIAKQMICEENIIGVFDVENGSQSDVTAKYGDTIRYVRKLTPAVLEYYQWAFCMYAALPKLYDSNIYLTSYLNVSNKKEAIYCGADFLFLSQTGQAEETAYFLLEGSDEKEYAQQIMKTAGKTCADETLSMEELKKIRIRHFIMRERFADLLEGKVDLGEYSTCLNDLIEKEFSSEGDIEERIERLEAGSDQKLYESVKRSADLLIHSGDHEAICVIQYIYLVSGHYDELKIFENADIRKDSFFYYIQGVADFYRMEYAGCISKLERFFELSALETEVSEAALRGCDHMKVRDMYECARMKQFDPLHTEPVEAYCLLQSLSKENLAVLYEDMLNKSEVMLEQGQYQKCIEIVEIYQKIVRYIGRNSSYNEYMVKSSKNVVISILKQGRINKILKYSGKVVYYFIRGNLKKILKYFSKSNLEKILERIVDYETKRQIKIFLCQVLNGIKIYRKDEHRVLSFKDKHLGERCFILGNGPSLSIEDLDRLKENGDICFASNKIYKVFNKTSWRPDYYACIDSLLFEQSIYSILEIGKYPKFFSNMMEIESAIREKENHYIITYGMKNIKKVKFNPLATYIYSGGTVTYVLITLAWMMGFREIYLIGCDHNYDGINVNTMNTENIVENEEAKEDYFIGNNMRSKESLNVENLDRSEQGYLIARKYIESHGGKIYNATRGGRLEVFPRVNLDEVLVEKNRK